MGSRSSKVGKSESRNIEKLILVQVDPGACRMEQPLPEIPWFR